MMGKSWSAINSLMVAARDDCPSALKAIVVCCGSDDRYNDDLHYMGGAMMLDNVEWPSSMWGWLAQPPDPAIVGERWKGMWRHRIENMSFWFEQWARHQTRDHYWTETSVRGRYDKVRVPVFILSGWRDGYKNPVERVVRGLGRLGKPVAGLIGPWGHNYPFAGYPGPRIDWLRYVTGHWWDRWLKGKPTDPHTAWPEFMVWLGKSRAPGRATDFDDAGKWVAEDHDWASRSREAVFYLWPDHRLSRRADPLNEAYVYRPDLTLGTAMLETSSWGSCGNNDLPGDQSAADRRSIYFESNPLTQHLECFGYPTVTLNLQSTTPLATVAVRLSEVDPATKESHLVTYRLFNLCYVDDDMASPRAIRPQPFAVRIPLNITGHVFTQGWTIRLSVSTSLYPTLWQGAELPTLTLATGRIAGLPASAHYLPVRSPRTEDAEVRRLLGAPRTTYVDPEQYVATVRSLRPASTLRTAESAAIGGRAGVVVRKRFDNGRVILGGALGNLLVDQVTDETIRIVTAEPLSMEFSGGTVAVFARRDWKARTETQTRVWSETASSDKVVFRYEAHARAFADDKPLAEKRLTGAITRRWV
jgi:putative CocE/NonD family hydrolase